MRDLIKNNLFLILLILSLCSLAIYGLSEYSKSFNFMEKNYNSLKNKCDSFDGNIKDPDYPSYCFDVYSDNPPRKLDTINLAFYIINSTTFSLILPFIPLLIIAVGIRKMYKELKSGMFKNIILIGGYQEYIIKSIKQIWKYSLVIPAVILFILFISYLYSRSFNYDYTISIGANHLDIKYFQNIIGFIFVYLLVLVFNAIFWLNLGLISLKKSKNYIVTTITAYIFYLGYSIIAELFCSLVLSKISIFKNMNLYGYVKAGNIWGYDEINSLTMMFIYSILLVFISSFIVYVKYRNKESVVIANEV